MTRYSSESLQRHAGLTGGFDGSGAGENLRKHTGRDRGGVDAADTGLLRISCAVRLRSPQVGFMGLYYGV